MATLDSLRARIRDLRLAPDDEVIAALLADAPLDADLRARASARGAALVRAIRGADAPALMEAFLAEYGLSTKEGVALMCLAEALLRVPDADTIDELIEDKIAPSSWGAHLGRSSSSLVNASTWALMLTGRVLKEEGEGLAATLRGAVRRLGEPVIRVAVEQAIREMGRQFVLGRDMKEAIARGREAAARGYLFSYDMLGEAAMTAADAEAFFAAYARAIDALSTARHDDVRAAPGISIKLSALHPRYEFAQRGRVMTELVARLSLLVRRARAAGLGVNIDAEEADRLDLSLDVIDAVLSDPGLKGWDGFGVVVQAYGKRAGPVLDWLHELAARRDRRIMVRLVKGAYWDAEIKRAQVEGLADFPVFATKAATDVSYLACAARLLGMTDRIYPQFATHNAHSVAAILEMGPPPGAFEFQRLHGMGEALHDAVIRENGVRSRIYAPVGAHRDLLAYLVRRLLENGANSSFVNQIVNPNVSPEAIAADPVAALEAGRAPAVTRPPEIFGPGRRNSRGYDLADARTVEAMQAARRPWADHKWRAEPLLAGPRKQGESVTVINPADPDDHVGVALFASPLDVETALAKAAPWAAPAEARAGALRRAADLYEAHDGELFALLAREAGKTPRDAVAELREAVDFLRYYADEGARLAGAAPRGVFACISPWNFPLAIFTGQIAAALAAGNAVVAKPAEATSLIAWRAAQLLHEAGVPRAALQLLPGRGATVGARLSSDARVAGICFTGSTATAQAINRAMAANLDPAAPLIAETGGLNAMVVDSTALPEQAIRDVIASAFQSAGQRCSALRVLYVQKDVADRFLKMLYGAMDEMTMGDPMRVSTDIGPVIDAAAQRRITAHVEAARAEGRLLKQLRAPAEGRFVAPAAIRVKGIEDLGEEIFGPVLHVATFEAEALDGVIAAVNASGYGLTFGVHSRIDQRIEEITARLKVGNIYVNRNQIGAVVGSQPFGGEGMSGTGPKAGGPHYVARFTRAAPAEAAPAAGPAADPARVAAALKAARPPAAPLSKAELPGPTGESNQLKIYGRGVVLCLGPTAAQAATQAAAARAAGCAAVEAAPGAADVDGALPLGALETLQGFDAVAFWAEEPALRAARRALAARPGPLVPLLAEADLAPRLALERHVCIDTTAAGGNAALLAAAS